MYAGAVLAIVYGLATSVGSKHDGAHAHSAAYNAGYLVGGAFIGLVFASLWMWMARATKRGRSWSRTVCSVLFGLLTIEAVAGVIVSPTPANLVALAEWGAGLTAIVFLWSRQSTAHYRR